MTDRVVLDTAALRVLAHPMRLNLLDRLRRHGPATARQLAAHFDLDSGAASYHLRRLAAGGLIVEDTTRGTRRDRWWRAVHRQSEHDPGAGTTDRDADRAYLHAVARSYADRLNGVAATIPLLDDTWLDAVVFSDHLLHLTPAELTGLTAALHAVIADHAARAEGGPDARPVVVGVQGHPTD